MLEYKALYNGKFFVKVATQYTSKTCNMCGKVNDNLSLGDRVFKCYCGNIIHRDTNASLNILEYRLKLFGLG